MLKDFLIKKGLSNREAEVAVLVSQGLPNKEVAERLFVTEKTVKFHLTNIYKKMNVKSRAQLIVWCLPAMNFAEEAKQSQPQQINYANTGTTDTSTATNIIPAGNTTVGGSISGTPAGDFLPHRIVNDDVGSGNGNSDAGSGI